MANDRIDGFSRRQFLGTAAAGSALAAAGCAAAPAPAGGKAKIEAGVNMEFVRSADKPFAWGAAKAAELGFKYVEPMVHNGRELLSEAGYFHSWSMLEDALEMRAILDKHGLKASALSAHTPLMRPDISVDYLRHAIRFASDLGTPVICTDEGPKPDWMDDEFAFQIMKYTLTMALKTAERYGITIAIEPHQIFTKRREGLLRIVSLVKSPFLKVNYDTGNAFLGGEDPYTYLEAVKDRVIHMHAKDIGGALLEERGKVTGTPVGVACGDGVIDWKKVVSILSSVNYQGVLSVECGTVEQAAKSLKHLKSIVGA